MKNWEIEMERALQRSIEVDGLAKWIRGNYFYRGWSICMGGGREYPWNIMDCRKDKWGDEDSHSFAKTRAEAMTMVDDFIENELTYM